MNEKRHEVSQIENRLGTRIVILPSANLQGPQLNIRRLRSDDIDEMGYQASHELKSDHPSSDSLEQYPLEKKSPEAAVKLDQLSSEPPPAASPTGPKVPAAPSTIGFFAKLLTEDIEDTSISQSEAIQATGANWWQWINYGIQPQVMPRMIGLGLYRFDINFRESAIVGVVGGGGIGATLNTAFDRYEFDSAAAILIVIISIVFLVVYTSGIVRKQVQ